MTRRAPMELTGEVFLEMSVIPAVHLDARDSCVTVTAPAAKGDTVFWTGAAGSGEIPAREEIPIYHKIAIVPVQKDGFVYKYGERIGIAAERIEAGSWIHIHNMRPVGPAGEV